MVKRLPSGIQSGSMVAGLHHPLLWQIPSTPSFISHESPHSQFSKVASKVVINILVSTKNNWSIFQDLLLLSANNFLVFTRLPICAVGFVNILSTLSIFVANSFRFISQVSVWVSVSSSLLVSLLFFLSGYFAWRSTFAFVLNTLILIMKTKIDRNATNLIFLAVDFHGNS